MNKTLENTETKLREVATSQQQGLPKNRSGALYEVHTDGREYGE
jgi:hypothetical protein